MDIQEINSKDIWERFIAEIHPHSFLHSWNWGEVQKKSGHEILRLGAYDGAILQGVALIVKTRARRGAFYFCPHGPIAAENQMAAVLAALTTHLKEMGKKEGFRFIRISPLFSDTEEHNKAFSDLGFREAPVHMMHPELAWMLDLTPSEDALLKNMRKTTRYCIKKAEKDGVEITSSETPDDIERFWPVYQETVERQHFSPFSKALLKNEFEIFARDGQAKFFFAEYKGNIVAATIVIFYGNSAFYHHSGSSKQYQQLNTTYLLQWRAIQEAKQRGLKYYNFWGVVPEDKTHHPWAGLSLFKRGFGGFSESYVHAKDLPLSPKYWISYMVEKVRRWRRGL